MNKYDAIFSDLDSVYAVVPRDHALQLNEYTHSLAYKPPIEFLLNPSHLECFCQIK